MFITLVPHLHSTGQAESARFGPPSNVMGFPEDLFPDAERWRWLSGVDDPHSIVDWPTNLRWDIGPRMSP